MTSLSTKITNAFQRAHVATLNTAMEKVENTRRTLMTASATMLTPILIHIAMLIASSRLLKYSTLKMATLKWKQLAVEEPSKSLTLEIPSS